jgi:hypothetical protein
MHFEPVKIAPAFLAYCIYNSVYKSNTLDRLISELDCCIAESGASMDPFLWIGASVDLFLWIAA